MTGANPALRSNLPAMPAPPDLPYSVLAQENPDYDCSLISELDDLYVGGYQLQRNAEKYLPKIVNESDGRHKERASQTAYVPYLGHIVDHFSSAVFAQPIHVRPSNDSTDPDPEFYEHFSSDADLGSSAFHEVAKSMLTTALVQRRAVLCVDFPPPVEGVATRFDEERSGATRAYVGEVPLESLIDWEVDTRVRRRVKLEGGAVEFDVGWFKWAILHTWRTERPSFLASRNERVDSWKVWRRDEESGAVVWDVYEMRRKALSDGTYAEPRKNTKVPWVDGGVTSFQVVPLVEMSLPGGLWVGNKLGPLVKEHFQRRSMINSSENRSLGATAWMSLGPEVPALHGELPAMVQQDPHRGDSAAQRAREAGFLVIGSDDELGYLEPSGNYAKLAEDRMAKLVDEIYRVSHLMAASVSSTSTSVGRSGTSKQEDRHSTAIVLSALGCIVREMARRVYEVISDARSEVVEWVASGLDHYDLTDRAEVIAEATQVDAVAIPSVTFKTQYKTELAMRLMPQLSPEEQNTIRDEIEAGIREADEAAKALAAAAPAAPAPADAAEDEDPAESPPGAGKQEPTDV